MPEPWSVKRDRTRRALVAAALDLGRTRDFATVTVEEIVERAGSSRTTFFRTFATKNDALLHLVDLGHEDLVREARRTLTADPMWAGLRLACVTSTRPLLRHPETMRAALTVIARHPLLHADRLARTDAVRRQLVALLAPTSGDPRPDLAVRCALVVLDAATDAWREDDGVDVVRAVVAGFDRLAPSFA